MSHWNHRVVEHDESTPSWFGIHEVFYDDDGNVDGLTENAVSPFGESHMELVDDLIRMRSAFRRPSIKWSEVAK